MKKIILFSLLALTACKKEKKEVPTSQGKTSHTIQVTGNSMVSDLNINGAHYYGGTQPVFTIETGQTASLTDTGPDPTNYRNTTFLVDGKVYKTYQGNATFTVTYTAN